MVKAKFEKRKIERTYIISQAEIKEFLGIEGEITSIVLDEGLTVEEIENGKSRDKTTWEIITNE